MENRPLCEEFSNSRCFNAAPRIYSACGTSCRQLGRLASHTGFRGEKHEIWVDAAVRRVHPSGFGAQPIRQWPMGTLHFQFCPREQTSCTKGYTICPILSKQELPHTRMRNLNCCLDASAAPQGEQVLRLDKARLWASSQVFKKSLTQGWKSHLAKCCAGLLVKGQKEMASHMHSGAAAPKCCLGKSPPGRNRLRVSSPRLA